MASGTALERATQAYRAGQFELALELARLAELRLSTEAQTISALALAKLGRVVEAIAQLEQVTARSGITPRLCDRLCELELRRGRLLSARRWLTRSPAEAAERPERSALNQRIAHEYRRLPSVATELSLARDGELDVGLRYELSRMLRAMGGTLDAWEHVEQLPPSNQVAQALDIATLAADVGALAAAKTGFDHALSLSQSASTLESASRGFFGLGQWDEALELAARAARQGAGQAWQAQLELFSGRRSKAKLLAERCGASVVLAAVALVEERFDDALACVGSNGAASAEQLVIRGEALRRLNAYEPALATLQQAVMRARADIPALHINTLLLSPDENRGTREIWRMLAPLAGLPAEPYPADPRPAGEAVLRSFSGNRSHHASYLDESGQLRRFVTQPSIRDRVATFPGLLGAFPFEQVLARFAALAEEIGDEPLLFTYRAELQMWWGRYAEAARDCQRACQLDPWTRWAWLCLAACDLQLGEPQQALERLERFAAKFPPSPNALVYWGETHYRLGQLDAAERALTEAVAVHPTRVAAWVLLTAVQAQRGDAARAGQSFQALRERAAPFVQALQGETALPAGEAPARLHAAMEHALVMLRGNRSSGFVTYFTRDGQAFRASDGQG